MNSISILSETHAFTDHEYITSDRKSLKSCRFRVQVSVQSLCIASYVYLNAVVPRT